MEDAAEQPDAGGAADALRPGTGLLRGQYTIVRFLSAGGFGMTYLAQDSLERMVVIKECFPSSLALRRANAVLPRSPAGATDFAATVRMFGTEARRLARLDHPGIVGVHQVFEDNGTAYMALDLVRGYDLLAVIGNEAPPLAPVRIKELLLALLDAVAYIHARDILHRDIAPDNVLIDRSGRPVLIDFGAAREQAIRSNPALMTMLTVKDGYSPCEFYVAGAPQGPSSDLYALGATIYHLIAGAPPPDSQTRIAAVAEGHADPCLPLTTGDGRFDRFFVEALNRALAIFPKDRLQSATEWTELIHEGKRRAAALAKARDDRGVDASIRGLVHETNRTLADDPEAGAPAGSTATGSGMAGDRRSERNGAGSTAGNPRMAGAGSPRHGATPADQAAAPGARPPPDRTAAHAGARLMAGLRTGRTVASGLWRAAARGLALARRQAR